MVNVDHELYSNCNRVINSLDKRFISGEVNMEEFLTQREELADKVVGSVDFAFDSLQEQQTFLKETEDPRLQEYLKVMTREKILEKVAIERSLLTDLTNLLEREQVPYKVLFITKKTPDGPGCYYDLSSNVEWLLDKREWDEQKLRDYAIEIRECCDKMVEEGRRIPPKETTVVTYDDDFNITGRQKSSEIPGFDLTQALRKAIKKSTGKEVDFSQVTDFIGGIGKRLQMYATMINDTKLTLRDMREMEKVLQEVQMHPDTDYSLELVTHTLEEKFGKDVVNGVAMADLAYKVEQQQGPKEVVQDYLFLAACYFSAAGKEGSIGMIEQDLMRYNPSTRFDFDNFPEFTDINSEEGQEFRYRGAVMQYMNEFCANHKGFNFIALEDRIPGSEELIMVDIPVPQKGLIVENKGKYQLNQIFVKH